MRARKRMEDSTQQRQRSGREPIGSRLEWRQSGLVMIGEGGTAIPVRARRCFPWSEPDRYVSIRDEMENEIALATDLGELDPASRAAVERSLDEADFVMDIERIESVTEESEVRNWKVATRQGLRSFQTKRDEWPRQMPGGGLLIRDVAGDIYRIAAPDSLDEGSRRRLWAFVG